MSIKQSFLLLYPFVMKTKVWKNGHKYSFNLCVYVCDADAWLWKIDEIAIIINAMVSFSMVLHIEFRFTCIYTCWGYVDIDLIQILLVGNCSACYSTTRNRNEMLCWIINENIVIIKFHVDLSFLFNKMF